MNVETGTEAVKIPEKEYINGIFVAVLQERCLNRRVYSQERTRTGLHILICYSVTIQGKMII